MSIKCLQDMKITLKIKYPNVLILNSIIRRKIRCRNQISQKEKKSFMEVVGVAHL